MLASWKQESGAWIMTGGVVVVTLREDVLGWNLTIGSIPYWLAPMTLEAAKLKAEEKYNTHYRPRPTLFSVAY
jgi:hypothetical protein